MSAACRRDDLQQLCAEVEALRRLRALPALEDGDAQGLGAAQGPEAPPAAGEQASSTPSIHALAQRLAALEGAFGSLGKAQAEAHGQVSAALCMVTRQLDVLQVRCNPVVW